MGGLFGGKKQAQSAPTTGPAAGAETKLFQPEQVQKITKDYQTGAMAKWNQILSNMGAGGGTGGPDLSTSIAGQAATMGDQLGALTQASGYGSDGMGQIETIMRNIEPGIGAKYSLY